MIKTQETNALLGMISPELQETHTSYLKSKKKSRAAKIILGVVAVPLIAVGAVCALVTTNTHDTQEGLISFGGAVLSLLGLGTAISLIDKKAFKFDSEVKESHQSLKRGLAECFQGHQQDLQTALENKHGSYNNQLILTGMKQQIDAGEGIEPSQKNVGALVFYTNHGKNRSITA